MHLKPRVGDGVRVGDHEVDVGIPIGVVHHPDSEKRVIPSVFIEDDGVSVDGVIGPVIFENFVPRGDSIGKLNADGFLDNPENVVVTVGACGPVGIVVSTDDDHHGFADIQEVHGHVYVGLSEREGIVETVSDVGVDGDAQVTVSRINAGGLAFCVGVEIQSIRVHAPHGDARSIVDGGIGIVIASGGVGTSFNGGMQGMREAQCAERNQQGAKR